MAGLFTQEAVKEKLKARIAIDGPTGSGKTWTALQWAVVIADGAPIGVVDTENRSAAYYAPTPGKTVDRLQPWDPPYRFFHLPISPPYDPRDLARIIRAAAEDLTEHGVLVIDSLTHYWNGEGGTMDIVDDAKSRNGGNNFAGWKEGTPAQRFMLDSIIHAPCHVIATMRSKMEYVLEETIGDRGQKITKPKKLGMAPEQRNGVEYEFTLVADMDLEHRVIVSKSRCDVVADWVMPKGRSVEVAQAFHEWLATGVERVDADSVRDLIALFDAQGVSKDDRLAVKRAFIDQFGAPAELLTDKLQEAVDWIMGRMARLRGELPLAAAPAASQPDNEQQPDEDDDLPSTDEGHPEPEEVAEHDNDGDGEPPTGLQRLEAATAAPDPTGATGDGFVLEMDAAEPEATTVNRGKR